MMNCRERNRLKEMMQQLELQRSNRPLGSVRLSETKKNNIQKTTNSTSFQRLFSRETSDTYEHIEESSFKRDFLRVLNESIDDKLTNATLKMIQNAELDEALYKELKYVDMLSKRKKLPAFRMKDQILNLVDDNQIVVISGETGCGKTTQVAQFILDDFIANQKGSICRIVCTQPRRISAISVAQRVADERAEGLGNSVGYQIKLEKHLPRERGSITFCTTGVVLRLMETDASLSWVSHLILDEIHERDVMSDFILALIKKVVTKRKDLKIILMSATLNSEKFSYYYDGAPRINIEGLTFPVKEYYLEDVLARTKFRFEDGKRKLYNTHDPLFYRVVETCMRLLQGRAEYSLQVLTQLKKPQSEEINLELIQALMVHICQKEKDQGAILIFLPGWQEISTLAGMVQSCGSFPPEKYLVFPLHSLMPTVDQKQIFEAPPKGMRKIIIATNIAETSITIDDVVFVVDCGKVKITGFDSHTNSETLEPKWVSLSNARQRKGRAGRVKPGVCFHLYTKARETFLEQYQKPEILRRRLEGVILTAKALQLGKIEPFFQELLDSPDPKAVSLSVDLLKRLNVLTSDENLTPLGYHLAKLPMAPQIGKMILMGAIFSCLDPILSIAACLDFKDAFVLPAGKQKEAKEKKSQLAQGVQSDHLLADKVLRKFQKRGRGKKQRKFCSENFLSFHTLKSLVDMKWEFMKYLYDLTFVGSSSPNSPDCNKNSKNLSLIKAIVCAGLYPNVAFTHAQDSESSVWTPDLKALTIHPKSILRQFSHFATKILVYYRKVHTSRAFIHDATIIDPLPLIFFADNYSEAGVRGSNMITVDNTLRFECTDESTSIIIKDLRERFNWFLEYKISHPGPIVWGKGDETKILEAIMELITCEDKDNRVDESSDSDSSDTDE